MTIVRELDLSTLHLDKSLHPSFEAGHCLLEAVAYVAGEPHTDHPACASPILGAFGRSLNDAFPDDKRQRLVPLIPQIVGTADDGHDQERGLMAADWLIRLYTPTWLRLAHLDAAAESLEQLPRQATWDDVQAAVPVVREARRKAAAAWAATWDGAWAATLDAAMDAARVAAGDAARAAFWDATGNAAWSATWDAARAALQPTVDQLQDSAIELYTRMVTLD